MRFTYKETFLILDTPKFTLPFEYCNDTLLTRTLSMGGAVVVAQLAERLLLKPEVRASNQVVTKK